MINPNERAISQYIITANTRASRLRNGIVLEFDDNNRTQSSANKRYSSHRPTAALARTHTHTHSRRQAHARSHTETGQLTLRGGKGCAPGDDPAGGCPPDSHRKRRQMETLLGVFMRTLSSPPPLSLALSTVQSGRPLHATPQTAESRPDPRRRRSARPGPKYQPQVITSLSKSKRGCRTSPARAGRQRLRRPIKWSVLFNCFIMDMDRRAVVSSCFSGE